MIGFDRLFIWLEGEEERGSSLGSLLGPLFLLCSLYLTVHSPALFGVGVVGLWLSRAWQMRGFCYALSLLVLIAAIAHLVEGERHLWWLGLQASYAISFLIVALSAEQEALWQQSQRRLFEAKEASIGHLEEEIAKEREERSQERVTWQEKMALCHKEMEEKESELSTLQILSDVLRQNQATQVRQIENLCSEIKAAQNQTALLYSQLEEARQEERRLKESLNAAQEGALLQEKAWQEKWAESEKEFQREQETFLREIASLRRTAAAFAQLKGQFAEKSNLLHQTRQALFQKETAFAALAIEIQEKEQARLSPLLFSEIEPAWQLLEEERRELGVEIATLEALVSCLMQERSHAVPPRKKKRVVAEGQLEFQSIKD